MLSADATVIQVEADRIVQLAHQKFEECYKGEPNEVLGNLYAKAGDISKSIIDKADELHTCLVLIEEMEADATR